MKILMMTNGTFVNFKYFKEVFTKNFNSRYLYKDESYDFLDIKHEKETKKEWEDLHRIALKIILDCADDTIIDIQKVTDQAVEIVAGLKKLNAPDV